MTDKRWTAKLTYADANESYECQFDEFDQLGRVVEMGPSFHEVVQITITINHDAAGNLKPPPRMEAA